MTIQEAIKSGKPFKRVRDGCYVTMDMFGDLIETITIISSFTRNHGNPTRADILATDWEVKND